MVESKHGETKHSKNKRSLGSEKEQMAADYLVSQGCRFIERNFYCRSGEIDLIVMDQDYIVFVEVKYRTTMRSGYPEETVTAKKRLRIIRTARYYLYTHFFSESIPCRFDVIAILNDDITWIKHAFEL